MRSLTLAGLIVTSGIAAIAAPAAAVQTVVLNSVGIYNPGHLDVTTGATTKSEYSVPLTFTAKGAKGVAFDALGFCVDLAHNIYVGFGSQLATSLPYHVVPLRNDGFGNPLKNKQINEIGGLATLGFAIAKSSDANKSAELAAVQQAIWTVEYPHSNFVSTGGFAASQASYAAQYLAAAPTLHGFARTIVADNGATQAFISNIGSVPEPAMWVEMLAGFGVVGALSRRRRTTAIVAA